LETGVGEKISPPSSGKKNVLRKNREEAIGKMS
jgi:hypothetical protein